ncbi:MAG TPA: hydantoinase/oxoprolinase family protein [Burkholderiaceae bacterium]|nr:hydantoinase/oxoprolinase family protein [Burkholderiaceae bacterium]
MTDRKGSVIGWDIGGAHVKACLLVDGRARDAAQWPCRLWQGQDQLDHALAAARSRWPDAFAAARCHAVTMTGEMVDLFANRRDGVLRLVEQLATGLGAALRLYVAGARGGFWVAAADAARHWQAIASANWLASATWAAASVGDGVLVDIGSTTTDLVALRQGRVASRAFGDAQRLASGELVYLGVVRTPLCALARQVPFGCHEVNVMNEFFATSADVYRLTAELDPAHDQQPAADNGAKTLAATRQRLARVIGRDADDADESQWLALARFWREQQVEQTAAQLTRVSRAHEVPPQAPLVATGCGAFLVADLARRCNRPVRRFADDTVPLARDAPAALLGWLSVCAPAVAVALLANDDA